MGLAFEGGADTEQKIPRIINITADGAASENGDLRVGQLIRQVDGRNVEGIVFQANRFLAVKTFGFRPLTL